MTETQHYFLRAASCALKSSAAEAPAGPMDWKGLLQLAQEQKLTAVVFGALRDVLPEQERRLWRTLSLQEAALQTQRTETFLREYHALTGCGFQPLIVKGILCRETYPEPDARVSSDEDLYVPNADYPQFHAALLELGFSGEEPDYTNAHEARYHLRELMIEGHWELFPQDNAALNALNALQDGFWQRSRIQDVCGVPMRVLEPTDHMTFLLLHAFKHFINSGVGIRQICDVAQWSKVYEIDWNRVRETMLLARAEHFAAAVFDAGERYFGMAHPTEWPRADCTLLLEDALGGGVYGSATMSRKHSGSMTLAAVEDAERANRAKSVMRTVFPNRAVMETSFPWVKRSALLLPAAWTVRIVRYLRSRGEGNSTAESLQIGAERLELLREYKII